MLSIALIYLSFFRIDVCEGGDWATHSGTICGDKDQTHSSSCKSEHVVHVSLERVSLELFL